ncbi:DNA-binding response regulator [Longibacter salinarum]|uniref:DNA-binding response regulator n=1 Tax=Longibacter salinarum TaxID=1850348 RepID=A0A2A8CW42_9BACT|nr:response regulator transcription factor [Longibacter salinarum]PEN12925.1 DNA-binding response regulator [Longibacter salinarum]
MTTQENTPVTSSVFLIDDHPAIRDAIKDAIRDSSSFTIHGGAGTAAEAIEAIETDPPDIVVLDLSLPDAHGLDLVRLIQTRQPSVEILVFSMYDETVYAERALQAGARGYLMKSEPISDLLEALNTVQRKCIYLSSVMLRRLLSGTQSKTALEPDPVDSLTDRELEVYQLIGEGYTVSDIENHLNVSRGAVDKYRRRAMKKLGCNSVRELLRRAVLWVHEQGTRKKSMSPTMAQEPVDSVGSF